MKLFFRLEPYPSFLHLFSWYIFTFHILTLKEMANHVSDIKKWSQKSLEFFYSWVFFHPKWLCEKKISCFLELGSNYMILKHSAPKKDVMYILARLFVII